MFGQFSVAHPINMDENIAFLSQEPSNIENPFQKGVTTIDFNKLDELLKV